MSMTENEALNSALEKVKEQKINFGFMERFNVDENWEVMKALEEIQQYRAIGTVEDIQEVMALCKSLQETTCKYMDIGTAEELKELKAENAYLQNEMQSIGANMDLFEKEIRAKAIDEFAEKIIEACKYIPKTYVMALAEQMKAGGKNE